MPININTFIATVNKDIYLTRNKAAYTFAAMEYWERLKTAREAAKLTQSQLADRCGVSQPSIAYLENPAKAATGSEFTARFARALNISVDWLADEIGEMRPILYTTADPKIIAVAKVMQELPEYGKDAAAKDIAKVAELIQKASHGGNGTDG